VRTADPSVHGSRIRTLYAGADADADSKSSDCADADADADSVVRMHIIIFVLKLLDKYITFDIENLLLI
jgi:hypothetical protein